MTISTTTSRWAYTGNGVTVAFSYTNRIFAASDLQVYVAAVLKTLGIDYTVSGVGAAGGGSVTFTSAPANGAAVSIVRAVPATQAIDFLANETLRADTLELGLDKLTVLAQQIATQLARGLFLGASDPTGTFAALPAKSALAGKVLGFDGSGEPVATTPGGAHTHGAADRLLGGEGVADVHAERQQDLRAVLVRLRRLQRGGLPLQNPLSQQDGRRRPR
jgi:hypothetical protein